MIPVKDTGYWQTKYDYMNNVKIHEIKRLIFVTSVHINMQNLNLTNKKQCNIFYI